MTTSFFRNLYNEDKKDNKILNEEYIIIMIFIYYKTKKYMVTY